MICPRTRKPCAFSASCDAPYDCMEAEREYTAAIYRHAHPATDFRWSWFDTICWIMLLGGAAYAAFRGGLIFQ